MNDILIIDDCISKQLQDEIENTLTKAYYGFPWIYLDNITGSNIPEHLKKIGSIGFAHPFIDNRQILSNKFELFYPIVSEISKKINFNFKEIFAARAFMHVPYQPKYRDYDFIHVDYTHPHRVFLYYVNDADGETYFFDKKYSVGDDFDKINLEDIKILKKVKPKKGRVVIFDGMIYHASSAPTDKIRCVVNFDLI